MKANKNLKIVEQLLKQTFGYVGGSHAEHISFDFRVEAKGISVYSTDPISETFFWPEKVSRIAEACGLSCYASLREIDGAQKIVFFIHK